MIAPAPMVRLSAAPALTAHDAEITNNGRTGDPDLTAKQTMAPDHDVVANMHLIVELGPVPDPRRANGPLIDGDIGAQFNVIADHDRTDRGDPHPGLARGLNGFTQGFTRLFDGRFLLGDKGKPVRSDHAARLSNQTIADDGHGHRS